MVKILLVVTIAPLALLTACSHKPPAAAHFEAVSITRSVATDDGGTFFESPDGVLRQVNMTVTDLISFAYNTPRYKISDSKKWITSDRFDIVARVQGNADAYFESAEGLRFGIRDLLADRFKLRLHKETRELPVYALIAATRGKTGPQLRRAATDCATALRKANAAVLSNPTCPLRSSPGKVVSGGSTISQLATVLSDQLNQVVLDQTGLTGTFEFDLKWTPNESVFTAVQEQLGLKLQSTHAPVDVLMIDSSSLPIEDHSDGNRLGVTGRNDH
jgi:uncharacterized protein (TIGR03435 family)